MDDGYYKSDPPYWWRVLTSLVFLGLTAHGAFSGTPAAIETLFIGGVFFPFADLRNLRDFPLSRKAIEERLRRRIHGDQAGRLAPPRQRESDSESDSESDGGSV
jgi:hypothetical protein